MKGYLTTFFLWALVSGLSVQPHGLSLALILVPFVFIYLLACIYFLAVKKRSQKEVGIKLSIIAVAYLVIGVCHYLWYKEARTAANLLVAEVSGYKAKHGVYPASSLELGIPSGPRPPHGLFYRLTPEGPLLYYRATQLPFDTYYFNFKQAVWEYQGD